MPGRKAHWKKSEKGDEKFEEWKAKTEYLHEIKKGNTAFDVKMKDMMFMEGVEFTAAAATITLFYKMRKYTWSCAAVSIDAVFFRL